MSKKKQKQQHRDDDKQRELPERAREVGGNAQEPQSHRSLQSIKDAGENAEGGEPQPGYTGVHDRYPGGSRG